MSRNQTWDREVNWKIDDIAGRIGTYGLDDKACPFCGNDNVLLDNTVTEVQVRCGNMFCGAQIKMKHLPKGDAPMIRKVIKAWNRRSNSTTEGK